MSQATYSSKGGIEPPQLDTELGSSLSIKIRDPIPELVSRFQSIRTYTNMYRTDAVCSVSLRAGKVPIQAADIYVDPMGDDAVAEEIAAFVKDNIFSNTSSPFPWVLTKILKMFQDGMTTLEPVWEAGIWAPKVKMANRKNFTMLKKLAYRPALTIPKIEYDDNGGPQIIHHNAIRGNGKTDQVVIPIEKAIVFALGDSDDYLGESLLRTAYPHWYYKTHLYKIDAIQKERHGIGIPMGKLPPGANKESKDIFRELLANLRTNEKAEVMLPAGYEITFAEIKTQLVNVLESATHHDILIMLNIFAEFMMQGLDNTGGGRATSSGQTDIFYKSLLFISQYICDMINMYLVPKLVQYNYDTDVFPELKVRNIGQSRDLQQFAAALSNIKKANLISGDIETENYTRGIFDMPKKKGERPAALDDPTAQAALKGHKSQNGNTSDNASGGQGNMGKDPTQNT